MLKFALIHPRTVKSDLKRRGAICAGPDRMMEND